MTHHQIFASAVSARENSGSHDGKFGVQPHAEAEIDLLDEANDAPSYVTGYLEGFEDGQAAYNGDYPELRKFSTRGWGDREKLIEELDDAHASWCLEDGAYQSMRVWLRKQERQGRAGPAGTRRPPSR